jgi:hypothetical protein
VLLDHGGVLGPTYNASPWDLFVCNCALSGLTSSAAQFVSVAPVPGHNETGIVLYLKAELMYQTLSLCGYKNYGTINIDLNLNSVNQLIFVMVKCGVLFEVRTEFLNNI